MGSFENKETSVTHLLDEFYRELGVGPSEPFGKVVSSYNDLKQKLESEIAKAGGGDANQVKRLERVYNAFRRISNFYFVKEKNSIEVLLKEKTQGPAKSDQEVRLAKLQELALKFLKDKNYADAAECFLEASKLAPKNADVSFNLALCLFKLKRYAEALNWATAYQQRVPHHVRGLVLKGHILVEMGALWKAREVLMLAMAVDRDNALARKGLAEVVARMKSCPSMGRRRKWERASVEMDVITKLPLDGEYRRDRITTLGAGGAQLETPALLEKGSQVMLVMGFPGKRHVRTQAEVVYLKTHGEAGRNRYGLKFSDIQAPDQAFIDGFVKSLNKSM